MKHSSFVKYVQIESDSRQCGKEIHNLSNDLSDFTDKTFSAFEIILPRDAIPCLLTNPVSPIAYGKIIINIAFSLVLGSK
jgi:hypothetical protein